MVRYKSKIKDNHLLVTVKISSYEEFNASELDFLTDTYIKGILRPVRKGMRKILYTGPNAVSLGAHLLRPIARYEFFLIIEQMIDIMRKIGNKKLFVNKIVFDLQHIFINQTTKELQFIYLPLSDVRFAADMLAFFREVAYAAIPATERDGEYISKFLFFLNSLQKYDADKVEAYIAKEDRAAVEAIKKQTVGSGYITNKRKDYYEHYEDRNDDEKTGLLTEPDDEDTGLLTEDGAIAQDEDTGLLSDEATGLLVDEYANGPQSDDDGTMLLVDNNVRYPSLKRIMTDELIDVNKPVFRIGKERSYVDYFVTNNNAVSRSHADIITRGSRFFIVDLNSKNRTYVNGQVIPVQYEIEIFNNDRIKLANEEFIFTV